MNTIFLAHVAAFTVAAMACLGSVGVARRIRHPDTRRGLIGLLLTCGLWSLGYVGYLLVPNDAVSVALFVGARLFALGSVFAWIYFCAAYTGRAPSDPRYIRLGIGAFLVIAVWKITNPIHGLYFTTASATEPFTHLAIEYGLLHWVLIGLSYAIAAVGFFMLFERFAQAGSDSRPLYGLVAVTAIPGVLTIIGGIEPGLLPLGYEPLGVGLFAIGVVFVYLERFQSIRITGGAQTPAIYLDQRHHIQDFNRLATGLYPHLSDHLGHSIEDVDDRLQAAVDGGSTILEAGTDESRFFRVTSGPSMASDAQTGQLLVFEDVTESERYRRQLEHRTEQLEALNRVVRHDIRNEISVILGWGESLDDYLDEDGAEILERMLGAAERVVGLTETARDFVSVLGEEEGPDTEPVDLEPYLTGAVQTARQTYPQATFSIHGDIPAVSVIANELLSSVFRNVLNNAVQHNDKETPEIEVSVERTEDTAEVRFADNGPGIPDEVKHEVFGKGETGVDSGGSGIGLYLVETITESYGGDTWIEDNEPTGAIVVVALPLASE